MSDTLVIIGSLAFVKPLLPEWFALLMITIALFISCRAVFNRLSNHYQRKWLVVSLNVFSFVAIAGFILQPSWGANDGQVVTLVTPSYFKTESSLENQADFLWYKPTRQQVDTFRLNSEQILSSLEQLNIRYPKIDKLIVHGDGLTADEWELIATDKVEYSSPSISPGFINPHWRELVNIGDFFSVAAKVRASASDSSISEDNRKVLQVELIDPAGQIVAESSVLDGEFFELQHRPKLIGNHIYELVLSRKVKNIKQIMVTEKLGVSVIEPSSMNILILQSAPSFETKQLQNWAAENGASVLVKSQISKDRFISKRLNFDGLKQTDLTPELLDKIDLVVADSRALILLNSSATELLQESINHGLGLLVLADYSQLDQANASHWLQQQIGLVEDESQDSVQLYWSNNNAGLVSQTDMFLPRIKARFKQVDDVRAQVFSSDGEVLVSSIDRGKGKIGLSLVRETARWVTSGEITIYSHYWQSLIKQISRQTIKKQINLYHASNTLSESQKARVCINNKDASELSIRNSRNNQVVLLQPSKSNGSSNCGVFWPDSGWVSFEYREENDISTSRSFYAAAMNEWKAQRQFARVTASLRKVQSNSQLTTTKAESYQSLNLWWFWWTFLLCISAIWTEKKLFDESF